MTQIDSNEFKTQTQLLFPSATGAISAADIRAQMNNIADSVAFISTGNTDAPDANDDNTNSGGNGNFKPGDVWVDETNDVAYICVDASVGAAVWVEISSGGGAANVAIEEDGTPVVASVSTINFTGAGVNVVDAGSGQVNVTITSGSGDVSLIGTPANNQLAIFADPSTLEGDGNLTWSGSALGVTGNIIVTGTVDGRDIAADGSKLDGIEALADVTDAANVIDALSGASLINIGTPSGTDRVLIQDADDSNNLKYVSFSVLGSGGGGDVAKVGTPVNNQVTVWTGDGTIEGDANFTWNGNTLAITGDITVSGSVDGRDIAADGSKLDGIEALADVTDETNVVNALSGATLSDIGTPAASDRVLIQDANDSGNLKYVAISELGTGGGGAVDSVNGATGVVVLDADDIDDTSTTNKFVTSADLTKLTNIEALADVTDEANVLAALNNATLVEISTPDIADRVLVQDANDGNTVKYVLIDNLPGIGSGTMTGAQIESALDTQLGSTTWKQGTESPATLNDLSDVAVNTATLTANDTGAAITYDHNTGLWVAGKSGFDTLRLGGGQELIAEFDMTVDTLPQLLTEASHGIDQFDEIIIVGHNVTGQVRARLSSDGGSTFELVTYWRNTGDTAGDGAVFESSENGPYAGGITNDLAQTYGIYRIVGHSDPNLRTLIYAEGGSLADTDGATIESGMSTTTSRINAIQIYSGITTGSIQVIGVKKSRQPLEFWTSYGGSPFPDNAFIMAATVGCRFRAGEIGKVFSSAAPTQDMALEVLDKNNAVIATGTLLTGATEATLTAASTVTVDGVIRVRTTTGGEVTLMGWDWVIRGELA